MADNQAKWPCFHWFFTVLIAVTISLLCLFVYDTYYAPKIITVDLKGYMAEQKKLYLSGQIDDAALKENIDQLQKKIKSVPENTIVLIEEVVVSDAATLTP